ncbi:hypothetical protein PGN35_027240 [Nodosilinea sp. PGN35]|uniref:hypothetical protein n=1 Tax=Nodosilinea sp. PGN35 TaxID=3020489 RepID=UPI0023B28E26|nr:hypothetical protein [Nodosilinea sp. TSF1-S3]MDF0365077.1 hypothetical protein [Nodosilinea sp. TSF1-S3]
MDAISQPYGHLLQSASLPVSVDTLLRPITLSDGDSYSRYLTGAEVPGLAGVSGFTTHPEALSPVLAQQFDQDILGDMVDIWNNFVESGQLWALLFGIVLGYFIRNLTAF